MNQIKLLILTFLSVFALNAWGQTILCVSSSGADAYIEWSVPTSPCGPFVSYEVWVSNDPLSSFSLATTITTETQTNFTHLNALNTIGDPIYYYIVYNYNCPGLPPLISPTTTNLFLNYEPLINSLNIVPGGIEICWDASTFPQTAGYQISYLLPNGLSVPIDVVDTTCFIDLNANINDPDLAYTLNYIDGCGQPTQFNTIGFEILHVNSDQQGCNQLIEYEWENYNNPYDLDFSYNIYVQVNGGPVELVGNQAGNQNIFNFLDFEDGDTIAFQVVVIDENGVPRTTSPWKFDTAQIVQPPTNFYIYELSVENDTFININYFIDENAELRNMEIDTSKYGNDFTLVKRYDRSVFNPTLGYINLPDTTSNPYSGARYYQIIANDSCNTDHFSTIGRTIYVEAFLNDFFKNEVHWNAFELDSASVSTYRLYRDYGAGMQYVQSFSAGQNNYEFVDDIGAFYNQEGTFCYRVSADYTYKFHNDSTAQLTTWSNIGCLIQRPAVYIPNAIVPAGSNNEFKPYIVFGNPSNYKMMIFNRWGEKLFESNDPNVGWFGTKNGSPVPTGGYPYVISFTASDGKDIEKKGIVTVVR